MKIAMVDEKAIEKALEECCENNQCDRNCIEDFINKYYEEQRKQGIHITPPHPTGR
jgi:hypothetical protein